MDSSRARPRIDGAIPRSGPASQPGRRRWSQLLVLVVLGVAPPAQAQFGVPVRLEGYWERSRETDPNVLGDLTFASRRGTATRIFGATHVQTYFRASGGIHVFTRTMRPVFTVTGARDMVDRFFTAPRERKVIVTAMYRADIGSVALTSVEIEGDDR